MPKFLVLTCSCLACSLVGVGPYGWRCSLMECPCVVSLIAVCSFTLFTIGCGCTVNMVLCLLCGWIFYCVVYGIARHLYCWSGFFLQCRVLALSWVYYIICTMYAAACSIRWNAEYTSTWIEQAAAYIVHIIQYTRDKARTLHC